MLVRVLFLFALPVTAGAHAIDDRYELPVPLAHFVAGATAAVALSFVVAVLFMHRPPPSDVTAGRSFPVGSLLKVLRPLCGLFSVFLLALTLAAALFGTRDPMMNLAPTMVWVVWWVGLSLVAACIGNIWPALDPWRAVFDTFDTVARRLGRDKGTALCCRYPQMLGSWPAVLLLLLLGWLEVAYPEGAEPRRIAQGLIGWTVLALLGRIVYGRDTWEGNIDVFSVYFATLGRFAPLAAAGHTRTIIVRPPGRGLLADAASLSVVAFIIAMLATVLFDGLVSGETWWTLQAHATRAIPQLAHPRGYVISAVGLLALWAIFFAAYGLSCWAAAHLTRSPSVGSMLRGFAYTLVPIAVGYSVAHNFSNLLIQGQQFIPLVSDPLGARWDLFGTATYKPDTSLVDARIAWYVAVGTIVGGHVVAVWLAHRVALRRFGTPRKAVVATIPLTLVMLIYTAVSLSVIAEPMVKYEGVTPSADSRF